MQNAFVILAHQGHGRFHYDFMLERAEALSTWQLSFELPSLKPGESRKVFRLPDHRKAYLTYEGPVSRNRGSVRRVMQGTYSHCKGFENRILLDTAERRYELELTPPENASSDRWALRLIDVS